MNYRTNGQFYADRWDLAKQAFELGQSLPYTRGRSDVFEWLNRSPADTALHIPVGTLVQFGHESTYGVVTGYCHSGSLGGNCAYRILKIKTAMGVKEYEVLELIQEADSKSVGARVIKKANIPQDLFFLMADESKCPLKKPACME